MRKKTTRKERDNMSKISDYKFDKLVRDMYKEGKSIRKIAIELNKLIPTDDEPISEMAVSRWLRADKKQLPMLTVENGLSQNGVDEHEDVNPYVETLKLVEDCDFQIESLKKAIEQKRLLNLNPKSADPLVMLQNFIARKQSLLADIAGYQKDMASYAQVKETLKIVFNTLKDVSPEAYEQFKKEIIEKQQLKNLLR